VIPEGREGDERLVVENKPRFIAIPERREGDERHLVENKP
jgi:hypothetical protein